MKHLSTRQRGLPGRRHFAATVDATIIYHEGQKLPPHPTAVLLQPQICFHRRLNVSLCCRYDTAHRLVLLTIFSRLPRTTHRATVQSSRAHPLNDTHRRAVWSTSWTAHPPCATITRAHRSNKLCSAQCSTHPPRPVRVCALESFDGRECTKNPSKVALSSGVPCSLPCSRKSSRKT